MKKNITVICLANHYKKRVAKALADELDMFYADINEIMEYNLINDEMLEKAGQEYFDKNESKTIKTISSYENTILTLNFSTINKNNNIDILKKNSLIIYIEIGYEKFSELINIENTKALAKINEITYDDRNDYILGFADIIVKTNDIELSNVVKQILVKIDEYYC